MAQVHVDPEELLAFAKRLQNYANNLERESATIKGAMGHLKDTWHDSKSEQFEAEFSELLKSINRFKEKALNEQVPYLRRQAKIIDEYSRRR